LVYINLKNLLLKFLGYVFWQPLIVSLCSWCFNFCINIFRHYRQWVTWHIFNLDIALVLLWCFSYWMMIKLEIVFWFSSISKIFCRSSSVASLDNRWSSVLVFIALIFCLKILRLKGYEWNILKILTGVLVFLATQITISRWKEGSIPGQMSQLYLG
jgi:hypothetical protein